MALQLKITVAPLDGCRGISFLDTTGAYGVNNTGGYGTPNPDANEINLGTIKVYPPKATVPYVFSFVVETGNIASASLTAPDGTVTNILSAVSTMSYPFDDALEPFNMLETYFGFLDNVSITDGVWTVYYENGFEDDSTYNTTTYLLTTCNTCCCITKAYVNLKGCGCDDNAQKAVMNTDAIYHSALAAANMGMYDQAQECIDKAYNMCSKNCKSR